MSQGCLIEVRTLLVCGDVRSDYYIVARAEPDLAAELAFAQVNTTSDQTLEVISLVTEKVVRRLELCGDEVRFFGSSEDGRATRRASAPLAFAA